MRVEELDWSQSKVFLVYPYFHFLNLARAEPSFEFRDKSYVCSPWGLTTGVG